MKLPKFLQRIFQQDGWLSRPVSSLSQQLINFERTAIEKLMDIQERLARIDEKLDAQAERLRQTISEIREQVTQELTEEQERKFAPLLDKLDEDVNNFAGIGGATTQSSTGGTTGDGSGSATQPADVAGDPVSGTDAGSGDAASPGDTSATDTTGSNPVS